MGLPLNASRISLKDMVGELDATAAKRILGKAIDALKEKDLNIPFGLHLHDTGLAEDAYVAAIKICKEKDYPVTIDTVECDFLDVKYTGKNAWKNTGFANFLSINDKLKTQGIDLGINPEDRHKLKRISTLTAQLAKKYDIRRVDSTLNDTQLRQFHVPGGGFASFSIAVQAMGLAKILKVSEAQALEIAGHALNLVHKPMGQPFAVTPGFQNKQIAA